METKQCKRCKIFKPLTSFSKHKGRRDGLHSWCKDCKNEDSRERNRLDPTKNKNRNKKWRESHKDKTRVYSHDWQKSHVQELIEYKRILRAKYPEKFKARNAVKIAVRSGKLPPISSLKCVYCGNQANEYHHYKGYSEEHWLDVQAVCQPCHRLAEK